MLGGAERAGCAVARLVLESSHAKAVESISGRAEGDAGESGTDEVRRFAELLPERGPALSVAAGGLGTLCFPLVEDDRGGQVSLHERHHLPHLCLWIDAPWSAEGGRYPCDPHLRAIADSPCHVHLVMNSSTASELVALWQWRNVLPIAHAIDEACFAPSGAEPEYDIVMRCGRGDESPSEHMLEQLEADEPDIEAIRRDQASRAGQDALDRLAQQGYAGSGPAAVVESLVAQRLADPHRPTLDQLAAAARTHPEAGAMFQTLVGDLEMYRDVMMELRRIDAWRRGFDFTWLSRRRSSLLIGEGLRDWPHAADRISAVSHEALDAQYARGRVGLSVLRWRDDVGIDSRPYELAASGVAVLQGKRAGIDESFHVGQEIAVYDTPTGALATLDRLLNDDAARASLAAAGRERVLRDHTWTVRFREILAAIGFRSRR